MVIVLSLFIALIIYLFTFYFYAKDDYFFIRKGITMEQLFNVLLIGLLWSVFFARFFYVLLHFSPQYFSPIRFFLIPYFPGVSLFGAIFGLVAGYAYLTKRRKIPRRRFTDYVAVALLASFPLMFLGVFFNTYLLVMSTVLILFFIKVLLPKHYKGTLKEGSISDIFLIMISFVFFLQDIFLLYTNNKLLSKESFLFLGLFIISLISLIQIEMNRNKI